MAVIILPVLYCRGLRRSVGQRWRAAFALGLVTAESRDAVGGQAQASMLKRRLGSISFQNLALLVIQDTIGGFLFSGGPSDGDQRNRVKPNSRTGSKESPGMDRTE